MVQFLKKYSDAPNDDEHFNRIVDYLENTKGLCMGLSLMWGYAHKTSDGQKTDDKTSDDIQNFNHITQTLCKWDGEAELPAKDRTEIERFIGNVIWYQGSQDVMDMNTEYSTYFRFMHDQMKFDKSLEDTKGRTLTETHSEEPTLYSKDVLVKKLEATVKAGELIFSNSVDDRGNHAMTIYQSEKDGKIHFYDSNKDAPSVVDNIEELTDKLWESSFP